MLGIVRGRRTRKLSWLRDTDSQPKFERQPLTDGLVTKVDTPLFKPSVRALDAWLVLDAERPGLWPDQLSEDPVEPGDDADDVEEAALTTRRAPINRIYYGPPGTGKTYQLQQVAC